MQLEIGDLIPNFEAIDESDAFISNTTLLGSFTILFFYPKDMTPGCTLEACAFRDNMKKLS